MKTHTLTTILTLMVCVGLLLVSFRKPQNDVSSIGEVKYSMLPPDLFNETQTGTWVLLDGKPLSQETTLYSFLEGKMRLDILPKQQNTHILPNARGRFIRSMNINGQGDDPETYRKVGSYQKDMFQKHTHVIGISVSDKAAGSQMGRPRFPDFAQPANRAPFQTNNPANGNTGEETRPKNIALYTYIKITN